MKPWSLVSTFCSLVLLFGCTASHATLIESRPEGARIELNGELLGYAPLLYYHQTAHARCLWLSRGTLTATIDEEQGWEPATFDYSQRTAIDERILLEPKKEFVTAEELGRIAERAEQRRRSQPVPPEDLCETCAQRLERASISLTNPTP